MPHVIVKLFPGRSEAEKSELAEAIAQTLIDVMKVGEESISVGIEEVAPAAWVDAVYKPDIETRAGQIYKQPGYDPYK